MTLASGYPYFREKFGIICNSNTEGILKVLVFQIAKLAHILQKAQASLLQSEKIKFVPLICKQ